MKYNSIDRIRAVINFISFSIFLYILGSIIFWLFYILPNKAFMLPPAYILFSFITWFIGLTSYIYFLRAFIAIEEHLLYLRNKLDSKI